MSKDVKSYYDQNTSLFLKLSGNNSASSIHQPLWTKKVQSRHEALNATNELVLEEFPDGSDTILDLGCGVGGSLFYLTNKTGANGFGLTISSTQVAIARDLATKKYLADKTSFIEGSFLDIPNTIPQSDLAYAIEAFVHAEDASRFFEQALKKLKPGGKLVLIDDFLSQKKLTLKEEQIILDFEAGWLLGSLIRNDQAAAMAEQVGFHLVSDTDLTSYLSIDSLRDQMIRFYLKSFRWLLGNTSYFKSQIGGDARQQALKGGLVKYRKMVFIKPNCT